MTWSLPHRRWPYDLAGLLRCSTVARLLDVFISPTTRSCIDSQAGLGMIPALTSNPSQILPQRHLLVSNQTF